jgi:hypothetical protein
LLLLYNMLHAQLLLLPACTLCASGSISDISLHLCHYPLGNQPWVSFRTF